MRGALLVGLLLLLAPRLQRVYHFLLHGVDVALLLLQSAISCFDHPLHELELLLAQVALLGLALQLRVFPLSALFALGQPRSPGLFLLLCVNDILATAIAGSFALEHVVDHALDVARLRLLLDLRPVLHDRVFEFDAELVPSQRLPVPFDAVPFVVVEDVVESKRVIRPVDISLDLILGSLEILTLALDLFEFIMAEHKDRDIGEAHKVGIGVVFDHEGPVVDDCASSKPLDHEALIFSPPVVLGRDLHDASLNEEQMFRHFILFADETTPVIGLAIHGIDDLLLRVQAQGVEVGDLVHLHIEPASQVVLVLVGLLLEVRGERFEGFRELQEVRLLEHS